MEVSIVFCGQCNGGLIDSGFDTPSKLKCCECGNTETFKVGKVRIENGTVDVATLMEQARRDVRAY